MKLSIDSFPEYLNVENNKLNLLAIKQLLANMEKNKLVYRYKQKIEFDEAVFNMLWNIYYDGLLFYDVNYNRKTDIDSYFKYLIDGLLNGNKINFFALFCPGYTKDGYKNYLGTTTTWKLKELKKILEFYKNNDLDVNIQCCYSDVFLENTDGTKNKNWQFEMEYNRALFRQEASENFFSSEIINASDLSVFSSAKDVCGYVNYDIINGIRAKLYNSFTIVNRKFYNKLGFSEEEMKYRNDRLVTMYKILSDYLNSERNTIFLPMENMYERENIFSENGTCTMYLKLKK